MKATPCHTDEIGERIVQYVTKRGYHDTKWYPKTVKSNDRAGGVLAKYCDISDTYEVPSAQ